MPYTHRPAQPLHLTRTRFSGKKKKLNECGASQGDVGRRVTCCPGHLKETQDRTSLVGPAEAAWEATPCLQATLQRVPGLGGCSSLRSTLRIEFASQPPCAAALPQTPVVFGPRCWCKRPTPSHSNPGLEPSRGGTHFQDGFIVGGRGAPRPQGEFAGIPLYVLRHTQL